MLIVFPNLAEKQADRIREAAGKHGFECRFFQKASQALPYAPDAEIILGGNPVLSQNAPKLRWFCSRFAGTDPFMVPDAFANPDAMLTSSSGAYGVTISEHIIMVVLEILRRQMEYWEHLQKREWLRRLPVRSIYGSRITLLGTGDIGQETARRLKAFGPAQITGVNRSGRNPGDLFDRVLTGESMDEILPETDILIISLPGTKDSFHIIGEKEMKLLPDDAVVINVGRGSVLDQAAYVGAICVPGAAEYTRKQIDELTEWVKRPQVGARGLIYIRVNADGSFKSSIDKFYTPEDLSLMAKAAEAQPGDLMLVMSGPAKRKVQTMLGVLRLEMGGRLGYRKPNEFAPLWIVDFPLLEWDDETQRFYAMHHPFTAPKPEHEQWFYSNKKEDLERVCANAYDFVLNGNELGGGSIRIHNADMQKRMFEVLGIGPEEAEYKFGFIINAFKFGAPPHGGLAFGFDRVCALMGGQDTIRDYIAFPKNNQGRDVMIDSPSQIDQEQLDELQIALNVKAQ